MLVWKNNTKKERGFWESVQRNGMALSNILKYDKSKGRINMTKDTVRRNQAGAVIHNDIEKFAYLNIPTIIKEEDAPLFKVLSVGCASVDEPASVSIDRIKMARTYTPIVTIKNKDSSVQAYRLPLELLEWVFACMHSAENDHNLFPRKVAFGIIDNKYYVELK